MELKEIEKKLEYYFPGSHYGRQQAMELIQAYGKEQYNQALTSVYARWINNECLLTERDFAELKKH